MASGSKIDGKINTGGTNSGRKTLATHGGGRLRIVKYYLEWPAITNNTTAAVTYQVIVGFTNWNEGDNIQHVLETITIPINSTKTAGNKTYTLSIYGPIGRDMYGRITVTSPSSGSTIMANKQFYFQATEYYQENRPTVTAGSSTITQAQITSLTNWKNYSLAGSSLTPGLNSKFMLIKDSTVGRVIYNSDVGAASGYTAISSAPGQYTSITAAWYNGR